MNLEKEIQAQPWLTRECQALLWEAQLSVHSLDAHTLLACTVVLKEQGSGGTHL